MIEANNEQNVMTADVPNTFIQTRMPSNKEEQECVIKTITSVLVGMLITLDLEAYSKHVVF